MTKPAGAALPPPHDAYVLHAPEGLPAPLVVTSPHSGRAYPSEFLRDSLLDTQAIRSSEDAFVDQLLADVPALGVPLLTATLPRAYIDVNRAEDDLDPALIRDVPRARNARVAAGLGVIPRVVGGGRVIRSGKICRDTAQARIEAGWRPWHSALEQMMAPRPVLLLDMHSMPHAIAGGADVVLGDRHGAACAPELTALVAGALSAQGLKVVHNRPFAGAYVLERHGRPAEGRHALQIEIDRRLYMDEATLTPNAGFAALRATLTRAVAEIRAALPLPAAIAAE